MRAFLVLPLLALALVGCKVTKDETNDTVTAEFNQDVAENAAMDATNVAENVGEAIGNDVEKAADKVQNVDVDVSTDGNKAN
jgi:hypothetical protein